MSYSKIADTINAKFNTAYTRYAALSRGQRMGLGCLDRPEPSLPGGADRPQPSSPERPSLQSLREVRAGPTADVFCWPKAFSETVELPKLRCAEVVPRHLSLVELGPADCRYPYGGDSEGEVVTYCGHPCQPGSSYCTPHFELSRNPKLLARPVLSIDWLRVVGAI